jgi:hypothetical protein
VGDSVKFIYETSVNYGKIGKILRIGKKWMSVEVDFVEFNYGSAIATMLFAPPKRETIRKFYEAVQRLAPYPRGKKVKITGN